MQPVAGMAIAIEDEGHGYDLFGMSARGVEAGLALCRPLYERYFRVDSHGAENIPATGAAILAANHSGLLPLDAMMVYADVLRHTQPPRVPRPIADLFVARLPFVGTTFARSGVTSGARANVKRLLAQGQLLLIFPEGTPGIGKGLSRRYQLQDWRVGHAELALRYRAPVVPVAIIGAEEQWPQLARLDRLHPFGAPFLPLPLTPLPLPVRNHIHYGPPLRLHELFAPEQADDPVTVERAAALVKAEVERLIAEGLAARRGLFR